MTLARPRDHLVCRQTPPVSHWLGTVELQGAGFSSSVPLNDGNLFMHYGRSFSMVTICMCVSGYLCVKICSVCVCAGCMFVCVCHVGLVWAGLEIVYRRPPPTLPNGVPHGG